MSKKKLIAGIVGIGMALAGGIMIGTTANAVDFSSKESYVSVGELWNKDEKTFNQDNLRILAKYITGDSSATKEDIETLSTTPTKASVMRKKELKAGTEGQVGYSKKSGTQNINVWLGGLEWQVCYLSQDKNGNAILTLWLSNSTQEAFNGRSAEEGDYYGYVNGNLYSDWSANWSSTSLSDLYPNAMYGTSYVRAVTLNNGGKYAKGVNTLSDEIIKDENSAFALFTMEKFGLTDYIITPKNVAWQESQTTTTYGAIYNNPNDSWKANQADTGFASSAFNYSTRLGYDTWKDDYIWLPSMSETQWATSSESGVWGLNVYQRMNYDGETTSNQEKAGTTKGVGNYTSALRSGSQNYASSICCLYTNGSNFINCEALGTRSIRPALHLNLSAAIEEQEEIQVSFETNGGESISSKTYYKGEKFLNLPTPTKDGKYFGGWFLDSALTQAIDGTTTIFISASTATLYAKWEDSGYNVSYNLGGGNVATILPTAMASGAEFNIQEPSRYGYLFNGWKLNESTTDFTIAKTGIAGVTRDAISGEILKNQDGGCIYFKNLAQSGNSTTIEAIWEIDAEAKDFQVLSYNEYFLDNNITKETIKIHKIPNAKELSVPESPTYFQYDIVNCGDIYYYVYSSEGFMYLFNFALSEINLNNKFVEIQKDIYINNERFDKNGQAIGGDRTVYQWSPNVRGTLLTIDGNGHTIHGLYYNNPERNHFAMFYSSGNTVQSIENLTIANYYIKVANHSTILAYNVKYLKNCHILGGTFSISGGNAAGLAYKIINQATNCSNEADILGSRQTSGLFYTSGDNLVLEDCINYGDILGDWGTAGIFGQLSILKAKLKNCDNYGSIVGTSHTAGLIGIMQQKAFVCEFVDCDNFGKVDGTGSNAAGFIAYAEGHFTFENCRSEGTIVSTGEKGMFVSRITNNVMTSDMYYSFVNCSAKVSSNSALVYGGNTLKADTYIMFKNIKVTQETADKSMKYILVNFQNDRVFVQAENIEINIRCAGFQGVLCYKEAKLKNINLNVLCKDYTQRQPYQYLSNSVLTNVEGVVITINKSSIPVVKYYYGTDFSNYYCDWKSGEIGLKALSGKGFYQSTLTEQMLIEKGYTKKAV